MHPQIDNLFDEAEHRYLKPDELSILSQYVDSLPERLETYRVIRDNELIVMQEVANQLQAEMPQEKVERLERSIKNALLVLRYCAMGILLNDERFVKDRLLNWLEQTVKAYGSQVVDSNLYRLLNQRLNQTLTPKQMSYLKPMLNLVQSTLLGGEETVGSSAIGW
jgi:Phycobilisome protein